MGGILLVSPGIEDGLKARCSLGKPREGPTHPWTHLFNSRSFLCTGGNRYHLRCYMYQARDLIAMDKDSFSGKPRCSQPLVCACS